jgi:ribosomal protein L37E
MAENKGAAGPPISIEMERCRQCGGRLCTRLADIACIMCGFPWEPETKANGGLEGAQEPAPVPEGPGPKEQRKRK